ncbi:MAG: hypothetical protein R2860_14240 [Desulfobacterales bacterium]
MPGQNGFDDEEWAAYKDLKRAGQFNIVSYFATDAEQAIEKPFPGNTPP